MLGKFSGFFGVVFFVAFCDFYKFNFFENYFRNTIIMSNSLNPGQARHFVGLDLGLISLQRLQATQI